MTTPSIRLEPFTEADIDRLIGWVPSSAFLLQWAGAAFDFPLTPEQYGEQLEAVCAALNDLGVAPAVRAWLGSTRDRPRLGKALSLPLDVPGARASEFLL